MNIETILEGWLIPDERYPPFKTDDLVKLAFSIEETELKESDSDTLYFRKIEVSSTKVEEDICGCYFAISMSNDGLSHIRIPNSYGRSSLGKEIRDIGKIGQLEINVQTGGDPPHFHIIKRDFYDIKINISNLEILGYEWQINNAEISGDELEELKEWLSEKYNSSLSNSGYIKFIWMCITIGDKDAAKLSYVDEHDDDDDI